LLSSTLGVCLAFVPAEATGHIWTYELKLTAAIGTVLASALVLYCRARRKRGRLPIDSEVAGLLASD
jgi:uncharacterized membrane protein YbhN (UPF0104 family)